MSTIMAAGTLVAVTALGQMTADLLTDSCQRIEQAALSDQADIAASCPPDEGTRPVTP